MSFALFVITPEQPLPAEHDILPELFAAGLATLHLRKPGWSRAALEAFLAAVPAQYYPRIVLHAHYTLARQYPVKGVHLTGAAQREPATGKLLRQLAGRSLSASFHSLAEVARHRRHYDYVFLSPIFDSTSKLHYRSTFDLTDLPPALANWQRRRCYVPNVVALGGITPATIGLAQRAGFGGAAVLGGIWQQPDPVAAFRALQAQVS